MQDFSIYTYEYILADALARVPSNVDKREGSIIYDALAPACAELAQAYTEMQDIMKQTYGLTARGIYQDYRYAEAGVTRKAAIPAQRLGEFADSNSDPFAIPVGSRFSTPAGANSAVFAVTAEYIDPGTGDVVPGRYVLTCETTGTAGNGYAGAIIPIGYIPGLASAVITDVLITGQPAEDDDSYLARWLEAINQKPFGGNIEDYRQTLLSIDGVGAVQVYPVWNGGGTVKCSIISTAWAPASNDLVALVQAAIDPLTNPGDSAGAPDGLGTAPIGHAVTIATATAVTVDITATLQLAAGYAVGQVQPLIEAAIAEYFLNVQKSWGTPTNALLNNYKADIFIAQVSAAILSVRGVTNVTGLALNGVATDVICTETSAVQQLPVLGVVTLGT